jgi:DNA-binding transcriptional regulator YdaS (Cro superfamily)
MKTSYAIKLLGNKSILARKLGITRQAISQWGKEVPLLRAYQIRDIIVANKLEQL